MNSTLETSMIIVFFILFLAVAIPLALVIMAIELVMGDGYITNK